MEHIARKLRSHLYEKSSPHRDDDLARGFLRHELIVVDRKIAYLEASLAEYAPDDPHRAGDQALLEVQQKHRVFVKALVAQSDDFYQVLDACHQRLIQLGKEHTRITACGGAHHSCHADQWWQTLNDIEYCSYLTRKLVSCGVQ